MNFGIFNRLTSLRPVDPVRGENEEVDDHGIFFMIERRYELKLETSVAMLTVVNAEHKPVDPATLKSSVPATNRMLRAIVRAIQIDSDISFGTNLLDDFDSFGLSGAAGSDDSARKIRLCDHPEIAMLLPSLNNIIDATGSPILFGGTAGRIVMHALNTGNIDNHKAVVESGKDDSRTSENIDEQGYAPAPDSDQPDASPSSDSIAGQKYTVGLWLPTPDGDKFEDLMLSDTLALCSDNRIYELASIGENFIYTNMFRQMVTGSELPLLLSVAMSFLSNITICIDGLRPPFIGSPEQLLPTLMLEKVGADKSLYIQLTQTSTVIDDLSFGDIPLTCSVIIDRDRQPVIRPIRRIDLNPLIAELKDMIVSSAPNREERKNVYSDDQGLFIIPEATAGAFLFKHLPGLVERFRILGAEKLREYKVTPVRPKLQLRLSSGIDFLEGDADVEIGNEKMTLATLLKRYRKNRFIELSDGTRGIVDRDYMDRLERIFRNGGGDKGKKVRVSFFDLPEVEALLKDAVSGRAAERSRKVFEGFNTLQQGRAPSTRVKATLRPYQKAGLKWMKYLCDNKLGGCLADDMGLGKTIQTIALLSTIYPKEKLPSLIVMPRSLLFNWESEINRFAPQLKVETYYGSSRSLDIFADAQIVLSTYAIVRNDIERLSKLQFRYIVLDESQAIKNVGSQTARGVMLLQGENRLALSGTPIENNLTELYSLFSFLNPSMFGTLEAFNQSYTYPIQHHNDSSAMMSLRRKIYPFILRRVKEEVLTELPDRVDQTLWVDMNSDQAGIYDRRRREFRAMIGEAISKDGVEKSQLVMFQALSELRRLASVPESLTDGTVVSPKIASLTESVVDAVANGHKIAVFFNFIAGIELVGDRLAELGIGHEIMTGSTTDRKRIVDRFQTDPSCKVLLMTLKVGGVGLNLTAADIVYIFEPWWNKAAEEQAISRLHRMGQKATVYSFSMITRGTIEEKILELQKQKSKLFEGLIGSDDSSLKRLTEEDINFILS